MFLAIDIGNTNITCGIFNKKSLVKKFKIESDNKIDICEQLEFLKEYDIKECAVCSVVTELDNVITDFLINQLKITPLLISSDIDMGIDITTLNPQETGADRLVNACAANKLYSLPAIVIDAGSAITFDIIDKKRNFIGGIIMPGLNMQLKSLCLSTSKLPSLKLEHANNVIGNNTKGAILSGVVNGTACALDGLIRKCKEELGEEAVVIGTGGDLEFLKDYMDFKFDYINPNLTLEGLYIVNEINKVVK